MFFSSQVPSNPRFQEETFEIINHQNLSQDFENVDFQGVHWLDLTNKTRSSYRALRNNQYRPYLSDNQFKKLIKFPVKWKLAKIHGGFYKFLNFYKNLNPIIGHFQLRYNLCAASYHDLYFLNQGFVVHYCTIRKATRKFAIPEGITPCCLSIFEDFFTIGDLEGKLFIYDIRRDKSIFAGYFLENQEAHIVNCVKLFSEDNGKTPRILTASNDAKIRVLDLENPLVPIFQISRSNPINHIAFSNIHKLLASYSDQKEAEILDFNTGKLVMSLEGHQDYGFCLDWHPNGNYLATGNQDTTSRIWDIRNPKESVHILQGEIGAIYTVKYSNDGKFLATGEAIDFVNIYNCKKDYCNYQQIDYFGETVGIEFNPEDSKKLFIAVNIRDFDGIFEFQERKKQENEKFQLKNSFL